MAILQQADSQLAQKQIRKVVPISIQNQKAVDMRGQNNEATIKAVQDAIGVGAEIYQKMEAASLDLEYKEAKADMFMHNQNMVAQREIGLETSTAQQLDPKSFDKNYSTGEAKLGDKSFKRYEPSKDLSPQVLDRLQIDIDSYNNGFVRETQIMLAKKMVQKGKENLDISSKANIAEWQSTLTEMPIDIDNGIMASTVLIKHKESAGLLIIKMETELETAVIHRTISPEESTKRLNDFKKGLANDMFVRYADQDPDIAQDLYNEGSITIGGVAVDPGVAGKWLDKKVKSDETQAEKLRKNNYKSTHQFNALQNPEVYLSEFALKQKDGSNIDRELTSAEKKAGITQELVQDTILKAENRVEQNLNKKTRTDKDAKAAEKKIVLTKARRGKENYTTRFRSLIHSDDPDQSNKSLHDIYDYKNGIWTPKPSIVDEVVEGYNQKDEYYNREDVVNTLTDLAINIKGYTSGSGLGPLGVEGFKDKVAQYHAIKIRSIDKEPVHPESLFKKEWDIMTAYEKESVKSLSAELQTLEDFLNEYEEMKAETFINTYKGLQTRHTEGAGITRVGEILRSNQNVLNAWNNTLTLDPVQHCINYMQRGGGTEDTPARRLEVGEYFGISCTGYTLAQKKKISSALKL